MVLKNKVHSTFIKMDVPFLNVLINESIKMKNFVINLTALKCEFINCLKYFNSINIVDCKIKEA